MSQRLYVGCADAPAIDLLELDGAGALHHIARFAVPAAAGPGMSLPLALAPDRSRLYAAIRSEPWRVASYAVGRDGALELLAVAPMPASMAYISLCGRHLVAASYPASLVASQRIDGDGVVRGGAVAQLSTPANAHCILPDPAGRFAYVPCLGGDAILWLTIDPATGALAERGRVAVHPGAGPRHMRFAADGRIAWVLNELDASLDVYACDPATGRLTLTQTVQTLPPGTDGRIAAADLHLTPDQRLLYASERLTNTLTAWRVGAGGRLTALGRFASEPGPRGFAISPDGRFLVCAGQGSDRVAARAIDGATGALTPAGAIAVAANPNWITFLGG